VRVRENGGAVAVTLDAVDVIENGKAKRHFAEAEAELVGGDEKSLRRIAKALKKAGAIKSDQRPKMLQALDLAPFTPDAPASARASAARAPEGHSSNGSWSTCWCTTWAYASAPIPSTSTRCASRRGDCARSYAPREGPCWGSIGWST
jgi:hypothetical protein